MTKLRPWKTFSVLMVLVLVAALGAALVPASPVEAAAGDINITVVDMNGNPVPGSQGAKVKLWGWDEGAGGWAVFDRKDADENGVVTYTAAEIAAKITGAYHFNINTYGISGNDAAYSRTDKPTGFWGQFIAYDAGVEYNYSILTVTSGGEGVGVTWNGANSKLEYSIDLGDRDDSSADWLSDFLSIEKKNVSTPDDHANFGSSYGTCIVFSRAGLEADGYTVDDGGAANGDYCYLHLTRASDGYDETFLAKKSADGLTYTVSLVEYTEEEGPKENGSYNKDTNTYTLTFDPTNVFDPGNAWNTGIFSDGPGMKDGSKYYAVLRVRLKDTPVASLNTMVTPGAATTVFDPIEGPVVNANTGAHYYSIQSAIDAATAGDTIVVATGTYDEQVVIDKNLTLQGTGDTTIVKPSSKDKLTTILDAVGPYYPHGGMKQVAGIIVANSASDVTVKNLKVDGASIDALPAHDPAVYAVVGILYRESGGTIDNVTVDNLLGVMSLSVYLSAATETVSVEVKNSTLIKFQKNGLDACGAELTANIHHNIITGEGDEYDTQCQNGVIVAIGAEATVDNNTISDVNYPSIDTLSIAIMFHSSHGSADDNTITDCNSGVWAEDSNLSAEGNTITLPGTKWGCNGLVARLYGSAFWGGDYGFRDGDWTVSFVNNTVTGTFEQGVGIACKNEALATSSLTVTLDGNHLTGSGSEAVYPWAPNGGFGIQIGDSSGHNTVAPIYVTITDNEFTDWVRGIDIDDCTPPDDTIITITGNTIQNNTGAGSGIHLGPDRVDATKVQVHFNNIVGNTGEGVYGVYNDGTGTLDATNNWWGCSGGPGAAGCDTVSSNVNYDPWLVLNISANPASIAASTTATSTITADMTKNSDDQNTSAQGHIPNGTQVAFATDRGSIGSLTTTKTTINGIATATLTGEASTEDVVATVSATVNNASPSTSVTFVGMAAPVEESKSQDVTGDSGTISADDSPTGGVVNISGSGMNTTVTTAKYTGNPGGSTSGFQASGNYYDVHLSNTTGVSSLTVDFCPATASTVIYYWNGTSWVAASNQSFSGGCITVTITASTTPSLSDLTGAVFGSGTPTPTPTPAPSLDGSTGGPSPARLTSPELKLKYLNINPQQASANQPVTISTNVVNRGGMAGSTNVILKINGQVEESRMVSVSPGAAHPVKFTVYRSQPGTYNVNVGGQKGCFTIVGASSSASSQSGPLIAIIIAAVIVLVGIVLLIARRRPA